MEKRKMGLVILAAIVFIVLVVIVVVLIQGNRKQNSPTSASDSAPVVIYEGGDAPSFGQTPENPSYGYEGKIIEATEDFLTVYYDMDTNRAPEEYPTCFDGLITQNGQQNLSDYLSRPFGSDTKLQLKRTLYTCKTYVHTQGSKDATAMSTVYVQQALVIEGGDPVITYDPILIKLELKLEEDGVWRVNYLTFERSLAPLTMDADAFIN